MLLKNQYTILKNADNLSFLKVHNFFTKVPFLYSLLLNATNWFLNLKMQKGFSIVKNILHFMCPSLNSIYGFW